MSSESKKSKGCEGIEWWEMDEFWTPRKIPVRPSCSKSRTDMDQDFRRQVRKSWESCSDGFVPRGAFSIDDDDDDCGFSAYVGIVSTDNNEWVPGMLLPEVGVVGVTRSGKRFTERSNYFALVGNQFYWYPYLKKVPKKAVAIRNYWGPDFCIGRIEINGVYYVGMVHEHILNVRYKENEIRRFEAFDILFGKIYS